MAPVDNLDFWKKRIKEADDIGQIHFSVYRTDYKAWKNIEVEHKKIIDQKIPLNARVLDAGCGYGRGYDLLKPREYLGVDFSPDFIEKAKKLYDGNYRVADLRKLDFKDNEFDWAICNSIKHMIIAQDSQENWDKMEKELKRVAKHVLILEYTDPHDFEIL